MAKKKVESPQVTGHMLSDAIAVLGTMFNAIPKGEFGRLFKEATTIEVALHDSAILLNNIRDYLLEQTGEQSPIVKEIDKLLPRQPK